MLFYIHQKLLKICTITSYNKNTRFKTRKTETIY